MAEALGASRAVPLPGLPSGGPLDLLQLRAEVVGRLRSTGGRPTDPEWDVQRLVPFREERWRQLVELARELSSADRRVSAGQLAAILIERAMNSVHPSDRGR
ncbi:MAG: hypothetical protein HY906_15795 [Deltaproteobacteria bacterium]|nr:hypothetical protein [Deltaproteobacteria bacterium]